ncbi:MAG: NifU family protein [Chloroflexota bacterium]
MITIGKSAAEKLNDVLQQRGKGALGYRLTVTGGVPGAYQTLIQFVSEKGDQDMIVDADGFKFFIDPDSASKLEGSSIEYVETPQGSGFKINFPTPQWNDPTAQAIQNVITESINPDLANHGGFVSLVDYKEGIAYVALGGGCHGCGMAHATLKNSVEVIIKENVPEVQEVIDITNHASDSNPFYRTHKG